MSLLSSWFGKSKPTQPSKNNSADEQAIARYRYMLKTAPPETIEQAHAEAFAQLTPEQRNLVLRSLSDSIPTSERPVTGHGASDPKMLAKLATRAEIRNPGTIERTLGPKSGMGMGGLMAGSLLGSIAGTVIGSMIAQEFFGNEDVAGSEPVAENAAQDDGSALQDNYAMEDSGADIDSGSFDV